MPELPDITVYLDALEANVVGHILTGCTLRSPFILRSYTPPLSVFEGRRLVGTKRLGKRIVLVLEGELYLVMHLMIAGRLHWAPSSTKVKKNRNGILELHFDHGVLSLSEAGTKKRASLHAVKGSDALAQFDPGGLEIEALTEATFGERLREENHTLKRSLTDPTIFSGIGNAYSDEILHEARLSPVARSQSLDAASISRLFAATQSVLARFTQAMRNECKGAFPQKVTAFREDMAVHGKYGQTCPTCAGTIQRIRYASRETNYCPDCQTGGKLLADRALSRLLKGDWPKTAEELELRKSKVRE